MAMLLVSTTDFFRSPRRHQVFHFLFYEENKSLHLKHRKRFPPHSMFILCLRSLLCRVINCKHHHSTDFSVKCGLRMMKTLFFFLPFFFFFYPFCGRQPTRFNLVSLEHIKKAFTRIWIFFLVSPSLNSFLIPL